MSETELCVHLGAFTKSRVAVGLCQRYGTDAAGSLGYLWLRLRPKCNRLIHNPGSWVKVNATYHLRNYLRRECQQLGQTKEDCL